jgi:hypothetical protein
MLNKSPYYFATTRKAISVFGSLFRDVVIERTAEGSDVVVQTMKVPLSYSPKEKYIARTIQEPDIDGRAVGIVLPRMAFEIKGLQYDASRKLNTNTRNVNILNGQPATQFNPVPYNIDIDLYVYVKSQEDGLQIIEQILPFFTPVFNVTINSVPDMNITYDLPIILKNVSYEDNYDGDYTERREIIWTLSFTLQMNYYGYIDGTGSGIIKQTSVTFYDDPAMTDKIATMHSAVNPLNANITDSYTINSSIIEGFD